MMIAFATAATPQLIQPKSGMFCMHSKFGIGGDNLPLNDDRSTSLVNIWGFTRLNDTSAVAGWLYKNLIGQYSFQGNEKNPDVRAILKAAGFAPRTYTPATSGNLGVITFRDTDTVLRLENALSEAGYVRAGCFVRDLLIQY